MIGGDGAVHVFEHGHRSDIDAVHLQSLQTDESHRHGTSNAGQHTDDGHLAGCSNGVHRTRERFAAAHLENHVDAFARGETPHFFVPLRRGRVVDGLVGAQRFGPRQLFIAAGSDDHARTMQLGELKTEDGDTACAEQQHGIAGLHVHAGHQCVPGGQARARKRGAFLIAEMFRDSDQSGLIEDAKLREHAVDRATQCGCTVFCCEWALDPLLEKCARHSISNTKSGDAGSGGDHFARSIGGDDSGLRCIAGIAAGDHGQIAKVE